jgi:hypothetical protein
MEVRPMNLLAESYVQAYERQWRIEEGECHQRLVAMLPPDPQWEPLLATLWHGIRSRLSRGNRHTSELSLDRVSGRLARELTDAG